MAMPVTIPLWKRTWWRATRLAHQVYFWATVVRRVRALNEQARTWQPTGGRAVFVQGLLMDLNYTHPDEPRSE